MHFLSKAQVMTGTILIIYLNRQLLLQKRAHNETDIADNAVSVSYAAVELAKKSIWQIEK